MTLNVVDVPRLQPSSGKVRVSGGRKLSIKSGQQMRRDSRDGRVVENKRGLELQLDRGLSDGQGTRGETIMHCKVITTSS